MHIDELSRVTGVRLRAERERAAMKQSDVARHLGITPAALSCIEKGRSRIRVETLIKACAFLEADPVELLAYVVRVTTNVPRETST